jgi:hypothetical protein
MLSSEADLKKKEVPYADEGLLIDTLVSHYREDSNRGKDVFLYFVKRILSSVNAEVTNYRTNKVKHLLRECFTVTDEAFALLILYNSEDVWRNQLKEPDRKKWRTDENFQFKYTRNNNGRKANSWNAEGIEKFNELCLMVQKKRQNETSGVKFERMIKELLIKEEMTRNPSSKKRIIWTESNVNDKGKENDYVKYEEEGWHTLVAGVTTMAHV